MPKVYAIYTYPVKSLEGVSVQSSAITPGGSLQYDREFAFFDTAGSFVKGKNTPELFKIRAAYTLPELNAVFQIEHEAPAFSCSLTADSAAIQHYFTRLIGKQITLARNTHVGFPDDSDASGPTIVSLASLEAVQKWFGEFSVEELIRRFRVNIILDDAPAFWEDRLFGLPGEVQVFRIAEALFHGTNPCARCPVPTRNSRTGEIYTGFQKRFAEMRKATLPAWAEPSRFDHHYRFTVNTIMPAGQEGKIITVGDEIQVN